MLDRYSKIVLTVIAAALVGLLVQNTIRPVGAAATVVRAIICDAYDASRCARVAEKGSQDSYNSANFLLAR